MLNGLPRISFAISYGLSFASLTSTIVHTFCMYQNFLFFLWLKANGRDSVVWYRRDIARQFRSSLQDESDIHARLMQAYPEVPQWWYALMGFIAFVLGSITIVVWDTKVCTSFGQARVTLIGFSAASYLGIPPFSAHRHCLPRSSGDAPGYHQPASWSQVRFNPWYICGTVLTWS